MQIHKDTKKKRVYLPEVGESEEWAVNEFKVSVWGDEKVLYMDVQYHLCS